MSEALADAHEKISQLQSELHMFRNFMQNVPAAIYFKDQDSRFIVVSDYLARKLGKTVDQLIGRTDHDFFKKEYADCARADEVRIMDTGEPENRQPRA